MGELERTTFPAFKGGGSQMTAEQVIEDYLNLVKTHLPEEISDEIISELRIYIVEAATEIGQGILSVESAKKAVSRFGAPSQVAEEYKSSMLPDDSEARVFTDSSDYQEIEEVEFYEEEIDTREQLREKVSYRKVFAKTIYITLFWSASLSIFAGIFGLLIFPGYVVISLLILGFYFLKEMRKGRIPLKHDSNEWSRIQRFLTFPLNSFDDPSTRILNFDLSLTIFGLGVFVIGCLYPMYSIPGILLVGLLLIRVYYLNMRFHNIDPARFARREFVIHIIALALLNFSFGYLAFFLAYSWMYGMWWYSPIVMGYAFIYGSYLVILLTIRSQDIWWESVLPPPVPSQKYVEKSRNLTEEVQYSGIQEPLLDMTDQQPDFIENIPSGEIATPAQADLQEGPKIEIVQELAIQIDQQPSHEFIIDLAKKVKPAAKYILTQIMVYFLTIIATLISIMPFVFTQVHHWYLPSFSVGLISVLFVFMALTLFISGIYLHVRRYLIKSRERQLVVGKRKRLESLIDFVVASFGIIIAFLSYPGILWGLTNFWSWGSQLSSIILLLLITLVVITTFSITAGLSVRLVADIEDIRHPDSKSALRYLSLSGSLLLCGIWCFLSAFLIAFEMHGGLILNWVFLFSFITGFISFQKATSKYKLNEYWPPRQEQEEDSAESTEELEPQITPPMKVAVLGMRSISRMIIWLAVITIIASIVAILTLVDAYVIGELINDLYIAGIFMALACLPYFSIRYLLVKRKGHSIIGRKTKGESLLDAILVFPFCMVFLLKLQYYLNPYYLGQWISHWNIILTPVVASVTLAIRIMAMLSLTLGLVLRFGSDILALIESGHEKTLRTSLTSSLLLTLAIGMILGHDIGGIPESQKMLAETGTWEFILIAFLALITFQMITTSMKLGEVSSPHKNSSN
jgi:MFS family permease